MKKVGQHWKHCSVWLLLQTFQGTRVYSDAKINANQKIDAKIGCHASFSLVQVKMFTMDKDDRITKSIVLQTEIMSSN